MFGQAMESGNLGVPDPDCIHRQTIPTPYFFVGDAAFPLKTYILRPYPGKYLPDEKTREFSITVYQEQEG